MTSTNLAPAQTRTRIGAYTQFTGLETSRDINDMETGERQPLARLENATCDSMGQIEVNQPTISLGGFFPVTHVRHLTRNVVTYAEVRSA